jgi:exosome complex component MTR3
LLLSTHVKFAPFATRRRRGYVRDSSERDLSVHLETALRGVVIGDRWPKSGCEVVITVLEGEEDTWWGDRKYSDEANGGWGMMSALAGCITVASAALVDAGIDCVDMASGGVSALVQDADSRTKQVVLDPSPSEQTIKAACVVGYLQSRDEITELWMKGDAGEDTELLTDQAVRAAVMARTVLVDTVKEGFELKCGKGSQSLNGTPKGKGRDVDMVD